MFNRLVFGLILLMISVAASGASIDTPFGRALLNNAKMAPAIQGYRLPAVPSFVEVTAQRLRNARVLWANEDLWRTCGSMFPKPIQVPVGTPEFNQALVDAFAYVIPDGVEDQFFLDRKYKTLWADLYGGKGNNSNAGSGRAAAVGMFQIKGIGRTPLVVHSRTDHSSGHLTSTEAGFEVIWDQLLGEFNPLGSRVLAVIDCGLDEDRVLVVRMNPLRPAHYMPLEPEALKEMGAGQPALDARRVQMARSMLPNELTTITGYIAYIERIAKFRAAMFARRYHHPYISASNAEVMGGLIDFNHMSMVPDFGKFFSNGAYHKDAAGENQVTKRVLIHDFFDSFRGNLLPHQEDPPTFSEVEEIFDQAYQKELGIQMVRLTGIPSHIIEFFKDDPAVMRLGRALVALAQKGALYQAVEFGLASSSTRYDLAKLLIQLSHPVISFGLIEENPDFKDLRDSHDEVLELTRPHYAGQFSSRDAWWSLVHQRAKRLNAFHPELLKDQLEKHFASSKLDFGAKVALILNKVKFEDSRLYSTEVLLARKTLESPILGVREIWLVFDASVGPVGHHKVVIPMSAEPSPALLDLDLAGVSSVPAFKKTKFLGNEGHRYEQLISESLSQKVMRGPVAINFPGLNVKTVLEEGFGPPDSITSAAQWTSPINNLSVVKWCKHIALGFKVAKARGLLGKSP